MKLEQNRLQNLLVNWLELEKRRPYFNVIAIEKSTQIRINNVSVNLRIDRIDELSDGSKILID